MQWRQRLPVVFLGVFAALLLAPRGFGQDGEEQNRAKIHFVVTGDAQASGDHFIGVVLEPVGPPVRAQLGLEEGRGMLVGEVLKDSPAARAGLRKHDILLGCGEQVIASADDLKNVLNKSNGKELTFQIIRSGKKQEVRVKAERRSSKSVVQSTVKNVVTADNVAEGSPYRIHMIRPAIALESKLGDLPEGMTVTIQKSGAKPAKIKIQKGKEKWQATEGKLDSLPEEIRGPLQRMLGGLAVPNFKVGVNVDREWKGAKKVEMNALRTYKVDGSRIGAVIRTPDSEKQEIFRQAIQVMSKEKEIQKKVDELQKQIDKRLDELNRKLDELNKALEKIR